jgi:hypothetical protein
MAGRCYGLLEGLPPILTEEQPHFPPGLAVVQSVQAMTGAHASLAPGTPVQIHFKGVLLTRLRLSQRDQVPVVLCLRRTFAALVMLSKPFHCRQPLLLGE